MKAPDELTLTENHTKSLEMLIRELGLVGLLRFLQQFDSGSGDYTAERFTWLQSSGVAELGRLIRKQPDDLSVRTEPSSEGKAHG